jgi:GR25 family glycosyltransferase involved in LPS biosynthesis
MRIIIKAVPQRTEFIDYLKRVLPEAEFCMDQKQDAFDTFLRSLAMAGDEPCIHLEDDIIITERFTQKINAVIAENPNNLIQFFSMRKAKDLTVGSRWDNNYLMNQCFYAPAGYSRQILDYFTQWSKNNLKAHPNGTDQMICDWLKSRKEKYWIHVPSLVDHRIAKSVIDPRRSSKRQASIFVDGVK